MNYTYDNDSRLTQVTDPTGTYSFTFDNMGRLAGTTTGYSFLTGRTFTTGYAYDAASNRVGFTDPEGGSTAYVYDTLNRLQTLTAPAAISGGLFGFGYDALSRRTSLTRPNAVNTTYSYDNLSRLLSVVHAKSGTTIDGASYTFDNAGISMTKTDQRTAVSTGYGYDSIYQLLSATQGATTTESYGYDPVGNRAASLGVPSYTMNVSNQLTATSSGTYGYDNNGNTISKNDSTGVTTYAWDFEDHLVSVTLPSGGGTVNFAYDPFGRRIKKASSVATSIFAYDADNIVEETNATGTAVARYSQGLNIDEPLAMLRSGATSYYNADGLGSVTSLANTSGTLVQTYTFDSFGRQTASSGSLANPFQYTARESDSETGLYYYRARYYDSGVGRFISEDPLASGGVSNFTYTDNNPLAWTDPSGLIPRVPRCPEQRIDPTRRQFERMIGGPLSPRDSANLDRGCVGMASAYQGMNYIFPEEAPNTQCFATEAQARARPCKPSENNFIFAKQGKYENGRPKPGPDGSVPNNTISSGYGKDAGHYNYITRFPGGCYGWMDHVLNELGAGPQHASISPTPLPPGGDYPHEIWCSTCCSNCMKSK